MWVYSDLFTYKDIKRTHEDINKTPIHEIMGQNTNDLIAYTVSVCVPNKRNKKVDADRVWHRQRESLPYPIEVHEHSHFSTSNTRNYMISKY